MKLFLEFQNDYKVKFDQKSGGEKGLANELSNRPLSKVITGLDIHKINEFFVKVLPINT